MNNIHKISNKPLTETDLTGFDPVGKVLPGFSENGVTYESHTFTVHLGRRNFGIVHWSNEAEKFQRVQEAIIHVRHGGGHEAWRVDKKLAVALDALITAGLEREAFFLCWAVTAMHRELLQEGSQNKKAECYQAFVEGRLKKRKTRGSNGHTVWIVPQAAPQQVTQ